MKPRIRSLSVSCVVIYTIAVHLLAASFAPAQQQKTAPATLRHTANNGTPNDTVLQGTVVSFTEHSAAAPLGAHVVVQTSSGTVDVHLGNAALLKQNNISLQPGDSVRIAGSSVPYGAGTVFAARMLQKGSQSVALRNPNGIPLKAARGVMPASGALTSGGVR